MSNNVNCDVSFFQVIIINASQILFAFHMYKIQNTVPLWLTFETVQDDLKGNIAQKIGSLK